ncbi:hypothetical protein [Saccharopolyspora spinosa]
MIVRAHRSPEEVLAAPELRDLLDLDRPSGPLMIAVTSARWPR